MKRRGFIAALGGAAVWPLAARGQAPPQRVRRIGVLMTNAEDDLKRSIVLRRSIRALKNWDGLQAVRSGSIIALPLLTQTAPVTRRQN